MNNYYNNNHNYVGGAVNMNRPPQVKPTNGISKEKYRELINSGGSNKVDVAITEDDYTKALCTHRDPTTGEDGLVAIDYENSIYRCRACGRTVHIIENMTTEDVSNAAKHLIDCMETMKVIWAQIPEDVLKNYFDIEAVIEKVPHFAKFAVNYLNTLNQNPYNINNPTTNSFAVFNTLMGGGVMPGYGMPQQTVYNHGYNPAYGQGMPQQQPIYNQGMGMSSQPVYPVGNAGFAGNPAYNNQMMQNGVSNTFGNNFAPTPNAGQQEMKHPNGIIMPDQNKPVNNGNPAPSGIEQTSVSLGGKK